VRGTSMEPTFREGEVLLSVRNPSVRRGDIVAFYYDNKLLLKRVIAAAGDEVDIDDSGTVYVNGTKLDEPYISAASRGNCTTEFPCTVPDGRLFVLGDNRAVSVDSRSSAIGCIAEKSVAGKVILRIWPLGVFGGV
jgi:signal peptidase I